MVHEITRVSISAVLGLVLVGRNPFSKPKVYGQSPKGTLSG